MSENICTTCGATAGDLRRQAGGGLRVILLDGGKCHDCKAGEKRRATQLAQEPKPPVPVHPGAEPSTDDAPAPGQPCSTCGGTGSDFTRAVGPYECGHCGGTGRQA